MTQEEVEAVVTSELNELNTYKKKEDLLLYVKWAASILMIFDVYMKISYWSYSRFASPDIRSAYGLFMAFRPCLLSILVGYDMLMRLIGFCKINCTKEKKFIEDQATNVNNQAQD